ncbi:MAG: hypothetical protein ACFWT5_05505 [Pseudomonas helleri]
MVKRFVRLLDCAKWAFNLAFATRSRASTIGAARHVKNNFHTEKVHDPFEYRRFSDRPIVELDSFRNALKRGVLI